MPSHQERVRRFGALPAGYQFGDAGRKKIMRFDVLFGYAVLRPEALVGVQVDTPPRMSLASGAFELVAKALGEPVQKAESES